MSVEQLVEAYGLLGVFLVIFVSHVIPFSYLPGWYYLVIYASALGNNATLKALSIIVAAFAASLAKMAVYYMGRGVRRVLDEKTKRGIDLFNRIASKSLLLAIFIFAALPLPDDVLYVPLGIMGYDVKKYFTAVFVGKLALASLFTMYSDIASSVVRTSDYGSNPLLMLVITVILSIVIIRIRWFDVVDAFVSAGYRRGIVVLFREIFYSLLPIRRR